MIDRQHFFDVPVYRTTKTRHRDLLLRQKERAKTYWLSSYKKQGIEMTSKLFEKLDLSLERSIYYAWSYNEVMGWISLFTWSKQIRGEAWIRDAKKLMPRSRAFFEYRENVLTLPVFDRESNNSIFSRLLDYLEGLNNESPFKGRYIDTEHLRCIGKVINWRKLLGLKNTKDELPRAPHI